MSVKLARAVNRLPEWLGYPASRVICRRFALHTLYCRGRSDHARAGEHIDPWRWV